MCSLKTAFPVTVLWWMVISSHGLARGAENVPTADGAEAQTVEFGVYWPPQNPAAATVPKTRALLNGAMTLHVQDPTATGWVASIQIVLSRPADDAGREFWNSRLAFPEYDWMSYADFLGAPLPTGWPKEPEYAGGILAFFEVHWARSAAGRPEIRIEQTAPRRSTGFDWERWTLRTLASPDPKSKAELSDHTLARGPAQEPEKLEKVEPAPEGM